MTNVLLTAIASNMAGFSVGVSVTVGAILGFAIACSVFLLVFNARLKEWSNFYKSQAHRDGNN